MESKKFLKIEYSCGHNYDMTVTTRAYDFVVTSIGLRHDYATKLRGDYDKGLTC